MGMMDAIGGDAYAPREVATRNGRRPAVLCDAAALLMELVEAEMRRLPPGPRITLVRKLAALGSRELDETRRKRDTLDIGSSMYTYPDAGLPSDLQGVYYLG